MRIARARNVEEDEVHDHDRGLPFDMSTLMSRRRVLGLAALGGVAVLAGCATDGDSSETVAAATTDAPTDATAPVEGEIPEETAGPFPADGSNGPNVLTESGVVRRDITTSFGGSSGAAEGVQLTIDLTLLDVSEGGVAAAGAAVYLWHCDRDGNYSIYSDAVTDQNYLRGVQEADADGRLSFVSIFPGCYPGRWPHIHFEVYPSLDEAMAAGSRLVTSQIALPQEACEAAYGETGYEQSVANLASLSLETDNVFSDGFSTQLATSEGAPNADMRISLNVGV